MLRTSLSCALLLAIAACCKAPVTTAPAAPAVTPDSPLAVELDGVVRAMLAERPAPGVSVAVVHRGEVVLARGYGQADVAAATPVTPDTVFRIGSVTKSFTAAAILKLAAAGKLSIDDPITKFVPGYDTKGKTITVRHLLTHTSGIKGYTEMDWFEKRQNEAFPRTEMVALFSAEPLLFDPGARWSYSNSGYYLLGLVIEQVTGQPYADAVKTLVIDPAGLTATAYCPPAMSDTVHARGYQLVDGKVAPAAPLDMAHPYAAGSLCGTAPDLARWMAAMVADQAAFAQMITPVTLTDGKTFPYGFGLQLSELSGHRIIAHGGGINGFISQMSYYPDDELVVVVLSNLEGPLPPELTEKLTIAALDIPEDKVLDLALTEAQAAPFAGTFDFADLGFKVAVRYQGGKLESANLDDKGMPQGWLPLHWQGGNVFAAPEVKATLTFIVENGRATAVEVTQRGSTFRGPRVAD